MDELLEWAELHEASPLEWIDDYPELQAEMDEEILWNEF